MEWAYHIPYHRPASIKMEWYNGLLKTMLKAMGGGIFKLKVSSEQRGTILDNMVNNNSIADKVATKHETLKLNTLNGLIFVFSQQCPQYGSRVVCSWISQSS